MKKLTKRSEVRNVDSPIAIAHITTIDGSLRYLLLSQMESLQEAGYQVAGISSPGDDVPVLEASGIRHIPVPMTRNLTPVADLVSFWRLFRVMKRERFTLVHTHNPKPGLLGQIAARMAGVPIVVNTLHGFYFHENMPGYWQRFYIFLETIAAKCSDVILSQNSEDIETAVREGICHEEKIKFLGNGIDIDRFNRDGIDPNILAKKRQQLGLLENTPVVGFVGRLVAEKGILELFQAAQLIREAVADVRFLIIGPVDPHKADALTPDDAKKYGVADVCIFTGMRQDIQDLYAMMDVFVLPSHREGFPRAPMEASAMRVPCVVTDIRGCREAVEQGKNGLLVPLGDVNKLAEAVIELLTDRDLAQQMGQTGRKIAESRFDEQQIFSRVKTEYARLLREGGWPVPAPQVVEDPNYRLSAQDHYRGIS